MKWVKLNGNTVREIIPDDVVSVGIELCYGIDFASNCIEAPDEVMQNWVYDINSGIFSEPIIITPELSNIEKLQNENIMLKDKIVNLEDCLIEMANIVYA